MKQQNSNIYILVLFALLLCSIILNFLQGDCIDSLIQQIRNQEYIQLTTPSPIEETENMEGMEHEAE